MAVKDQVELRHEVFCRPPLARGDGPEATPRTETFLAFRELDGDPESVPVSRVYRCLECGAAEYKAI